MAPGSQELFWLEAASASEVSSHPRCRKGSFTILEPLLWLGFEKIVPAPCVWALRWGVQGCHWRVIEEFWRLRTDGRGERRRAGGGDGKAHRATPPSCSIKGFHTISIIDLTWPSRLTWWGQRSGFQWQEMQVWLWTQSTEGCRDTDVRSKGQGSGTWKRSDEVQSYRVSVLWMWRGCFFPLRQICAFSVAIWALY